MMYARCKNEVVVEVISWNPEGRYHPDVAKAFLPAPDDVAVGWTCADGVFAPPPTHPEADLALAGERKLGEIMAGSNACAALVKARYSVLEVDSWPVQQAQAETVLAGGALADDALLTTLAAANNISLEDFARRVMANVAAAEAVTRSILAQQQAYETRLKAIMADESAETAARIQAIQGLTVAYAMPDAEA